jgi:hypothetical protein
MVVFHVVLDVFVFSMVKPSSSWSVSPQKKRSLKSGRLVLLHGGEGLADGSGGKNHGFQLVHN